MRNTPSHGDLRALAIDPGSTTGWLRFKPVVDEEQPGGIGIRPLGWGEERSQIALCNMAHSLWKQKQIDVIVIEDFLPRVGVRTWEPEATEIIGFCRWLTQGKIPQFYVQRPGDAIQFGTATKIDQYRKAPHNVGRGGEGHAVMALRHAVLWSMTRWTP